MRRLTDGLLVSVSIETLDDIVYENEDNVTDVIQVKHHESGKNLTSSSNDFWKTVKIWIDTKNEPGVTNDTLFYLITTETISEDSIPYYLKEDGHRDVAEAIKKMDEWTVKEKVQKDFKKIFELYNEMECFEKENLFKNCFILDKSINISNIREEISKEIHHSCEPNQIEKFVDRLIERWLTLVETKIRSDYKLISGVDIYSIISELREEFKRDNLPVDSEIMEIQLEYESYWRYMFIKQLDLIHMSEKTKRYAVEDYYQSREQRSRWAREGFLYPGELDKYDKKLKVEWERQFEFEKSKNNYLKKEDLIQIGQEIYNTFQKTGEPIRKNFSDPFLSRGSYHILSDELEVGWHPQYYEKLKSRNMKNGDEND
ncbi:hypothetical protein MsAc7_10120 [Methanolapillus millepedarum]|uniref:ABC-three component systems C-terminal domain-containing protein n=1 Tax=Methanolapillus millepedarum TaxID=3028296 RepID=A0AA96ZU95_9EURY|nr:hypothetical protein MsAc7_10120 [Methanosarcinaceae archaeon Ac7]